MENNIPTLYIFQRDSYVVKNAKNFNYFRPFCPKNIKHSSYSVLPTVILKKIPSKLPKYPEIS